MRIFLVFIVLSNTLFAQTNLDDIVNGWKSDKDLINGTHSFCVINAADGKVLIELQSHTSVIPASTLKAVTTSAALGILGKYYRYETKIYFTGTFDKTSGIFLVILITLFILVILYFIICLVKLFVPISLFNI